MNLVVMKLSSTLPGKFQGLSKGISAKLMKDTEFS